MKSRLAVSILFILIASTFTSDAAAAFEKLRSWTSKVWGRCAVQVDNRPSSRDSALMSAIQCSNKDEDIVTMIHFSGHRLLLELSCVTASQASVVGAISPDGTSITFNSPEATKVAGSEEGHTQGVVFKLVGSGYQREAFECITTAAGKIHEVLRLVRIK